MNNNGFSYSLKLTNYESKSHPLIACKKIFDYRKEREMLKGMIKVINRETNKQPVIDFHSVKSISVNI